MDFKTLLQPHRTIPHTSWTAKTRWSLTSTRLLILTFGLTIFGSGEALLIQSTLGNSPWAVLSQGLSRHSPLSLGWSTFFISIVVLLGWIPLKQHPGFGTLANIVVISTALQIGTDIFPIQHHTLWLRFAYVFAGLRFLHYLWPRTWTARWFDDRYPPRERSSCGTRPTHARNNCL
jgi:uncharacterized membrane protein YczE